MKLFLWKLLKLADRKLVQYSFNNIGGTTFYPLDVVVSLKFLKFAVGKLLEYSFNKIGVRTFDPWMWLSLLILFNQVQENCWNIPFKK
jgi:hypothetical protein